MSTASSSWWQNFIAALKGKDGNPLNPTTPQPLQGAAPGASQVASRQYVWPEQPGNRYDTMPGGGATSIDLINLIMTPFGQNPIQLNADPLLKNNVNSIMIFTSDADCVIRTDDGQVFNDHKLYHVINFLHSKNITITPPNGKLPNTFDLGFVLSNEPICPYVIDLQLAHTKKTNTINPVPDALTDIFIVHMGGYDQLTLQVIENNVNDIDYQVLVSQDDVTYTLLPGLGFPVKIPKGTTALFTATIKWHFYKVQVKNDVGGVAGSATVKASPIR